MSLLDRIQSSYTVELVCAKRVALMDLVLIVEFLPVVTVEPW
jgi:hypothetical protein